MLRTTTLLALLALASTQQTTSASSADTGSGSTWASGTGQGSTFASGTGQGSTFLSGTGQGSGSTWASGTGHGSSNQGTWATGSTGHSGGSIHRTTSGRGDGTTSWPYFSFMTNTLNDAPSSSIGFTFDTITFNGGVTLPACQRTLLAAAQQYQSCVMGVIGNSKSLCNCLDLFRYTLASSGCRDANVVQVQKGLENACAVLKCTTCLNGSSSGLSMLTLIVIIVTSVIGCLCVLTVVIITCKKRRRGAVVAYAPMGQAQVFSPTPAPYVQPPAYPFAGQIQRPAY